VNAMSSMNGPGMVSRWAPARPRAGRPGAALIGSSRQPGPGDADQGRSRPGSVAPAVSPPEPPLGPELSEQLDTLVEMLRRHRLADLERRGASVWLEVF
jgi:hypothetical protein